MSKIDNTSTPDPPAAADEEHFERLLARLDTIVARLESGDASLEESLTLFEEGVRLGRTGEQVLDAAERRLQELMADGNERPLTLDEAGGPPGSPG